MTDINSYLDFVLKLFLALASPSKCRLPPSFSSGRRHYLRSLRKTPHIIVGLTVFGMLLTPPDVISLITIPMWLLFELGIFFGRLLEPKSSNVANE